MRSRLDAGLAAVFGSMSLVFVGLGAGYNLGLLGPAVFFGVVAYVFWSHGTGGVAERVYGRVESRAMPNGGRRERSTGAGPKADWRGPRQGRRRRRRRVAGSDGQREYSTRARPSDSEAYERLGVEPGASEEAVRRAYRERVKEVHPDAPEGDEETFKRVSEAYDRLRK